MTSGAVVPRFVGDVVTGFVSAASELKRCLYCVAPEIAIISDVAVARRIGAAVQRTATQ